MKPAPYHNAPLESGVYLFKNNENQIIYIGKAKSLKERVKSYFQKNEDWKTKALLDEYATIEYIITPTETEALLLETELIQKYQPKFNILAKSGQPFLFILFTKEKTASIKLVRSKRQKGIYFGPFLNKTDARRVFDFLVRTFRLSLCKKKIPGGCLEYHLGICSGSCKADFDLNDYLFRLSLAKQVLENNPKAFIARIQEKIKEHSAALAFEKAKKLTLYLDNLESIFRTIKAHYSYQKFTPDIAAALMKKEQGPSFNHGLAQELQTLVGSDHLIRSIDCFDISHFQGRHMVGSCIRFVDGAPDKRNFRHFRIKTLTDQNDYAALQEIIMRRYKSPDHLPDLLLIDGGKGQLSAARAVAPAATLASLAKREETLFCDAHPTGIILDHHRQADKTLLAIRDYAHHFAITYHALRRAKDIPTRS